MAKLAHQPSPTRRARGPTSMASGPNGEAGRVAGRGMRASRLLIESPFVSGVVGGRARVTGSLGLRATPSSPTMRMLAGRVEGAGQARRRGGTVESDER